MKSPRNISLGLAGLAFTAWMTWAVKPRYEVFQIGQDIGHDARPIEIVVVKNEMPHVPFVRGVKTQYTHLGGPTRGVSCDGPFTKYISRDESTCAEVRKSGVILFGFLELRPQSSYVRGASPEATAACDLGTDVISAYGDEWEKQ